MPHGAFLAPAALQHKRIAVATTFSHRTHLARAPRRRPRANVVRAAAASAAAPSSPSSPPPAGSPKPQRRASVREVLALARPEWRRIALGMLAALVAAAVILMTPAALGRVLDAVGAAGGASEAKKALNRESTVLLVLYIAGAAAKLAEVALLRTAGEKIVFQLRKRVFGKLVRQDVARLDETSAGTMLSRLQGDTYDLQSVVTKELPQMVTGVLEMILGFAFLFTICRELVPIVAISVPLTVFGAQFYGRRTAKFSRALSGHMAESSNVATEQLGGVRVVKAFAREHLAESKYLSMLTRVLNIGNKVAYSDAVLQSWNRLVFTVNTVTILWLGSKYVALGKLTVGSLFSYILYTSNFQAASSRAAGGYGELIRSSGSVARVMEILSVSPEIEKSVSDSAEDEVPVGGPSVAGDIEFRNVTFAYPGRFLEPALSNMSFTIPAGSSVAICGKSGGGKSTILSLLERFHNPQSGEILIDGKALSTFDLQYLRGKVLGLVPQEPVLFSGTIAENIAYGKHGATEVEIEDAARDAGVLDFTSRLPLGLETVVGPAAGSLSGGEKQRVMIARCLCKKPKIVILDEATSSLDAASEAMVNQTIERLMADSSRTVILISHRLEIAKTCDTVFVLERGQLVESGAHAKLARSGGLYSDLLRAATVKS